MTAGDDYKEFDTASIITGDTVSIGKLKLRKREALLAIIALIALIIVIILAIVLAVEVGEKSSNCPSVPSANADRLNSSAPPSAQTEKFTSSAPTSGPTNIFTPSVPTSAPSDAHLCVTPPCLRTAYYEKIIMNESVNPCVDFYQFACGGYDDVYTPNPRISDQRPFNQIETENVQKLLELLDFEPERPDEHSYERKLRHFMLSCNNHFDKMQLQGHPLVEKVIKPFGGWYVLSQWDPSSFDFHKQLKLVHIDFWTPAFFTISLSTDFTDWNKRVMQMDVGGLGLPAEMYSDDTAMTLYKGYIQTLAYYVSIDADAIISQIRINQFTEDVVEVETALNQASQDLSQQENPHHPANRMTLGSLSALTNNTVDFVDYFKSAFPPVNATFTSSSAVAVLKEGFFHNLGPLLKNYTSNDDGKRKLHNYLIWQLINRYSRDLSWEYVHAKRQLNYYLHGSKDDSSGYTHCFRLAEYTMREAMGAVFVKNYFSEKDKQEAIDMLGLIRDEMIKGLSNLPWMTSDNRDSSIDKIKNSLYKIGYPDYMVNDTYMDILYSKVNISDTDFFGNVLSFNDVIKRRFVDYIAQPDSKTLWVYHVMDPVVEYYNPWHELIVTSAALQNPLFAYNGPAYYNFGGIGTLLASSLIHAIDEYGSNYKLDQSNYGNWWTNLTRQRYQEIKNCAINAQNNQKLGPFKLTETHQAVINKPLAAMIFAPELLSDASGLSLSLKAYKAKMAKIGSEKIPAGFSNYSLEKLFFLAFAQANCQNTPEHLKAVQIMDFIFPGDYKVNLAVSQVKEFRDAYGCQIGDPMAPQNTCQLF